MTEVRVCGQVSSIKSGGIEGVIWPNGRYAWPAGLDKT